MDNEKLKTKDQIDVLMVEGDSLVYEDLIDKINDLFSQNSHKIYDKFYTSFVKDSKIGWALLFEGEREENKEETTIREATEAASRKHVENAELKEYLRLHKKYGKKNG